MSRLLFSALHAAHAFGTATTQHMPVTYNQLPTVPVYGEPFTGYVQTVDDATLASPVVYPLEPAPMQQSSFAWTEVAMLGALGAIVGVAIEAKKKASTAGGAVAEPDLESAAVAARIATLALGGERVELTRRDALFAGAAGMIASLPAVANAEDAPADAAAPAAAPAPKYKGPFDAPPRKADQSKIGVSSVKIPKEGVGSPGAGNPSVKLYTGWKDKTRVVGPGGASDAPTGPFDGGENKDKGDFGAPGKNKF